MCLFPILHLEIPSSNASSIGDNPFVGSVGFGHGAPSSLIVDSGRTFMGPEWKQVCDMFDMLVATCPPRAHYQCGMAERHGALISRSFEAMKRSPIFPDDFLIITYWHVCA